MKQRTKEERAAYMRVFRARKKAEAARGGPDQGATGVHAACDKVEQELRARIAELEQQVADLKAEALF